VRVLNLPPGSEDTGPTLFISRERASEVGSVLQMEHMAARFRVQRAARRNYDRTLDRGFVVTLHDRTGQVILAA